MHLAGPGRLAAAVFAVALAFADSTAAETVTITTLDGSMTLTGELQSFENGMIVIETSVGAVSIPASLVECQGEACPDLGPAEAVVAMSGDRLIATRLMPALVLGFADILDADVEQAAVEGGTVLRLMDFDGAPLAAAEIAAPGADAGFAALLENRAAIGLSARAIGDDEARAFDKAGFGDMRAPGREHVAALDGLAIIAARDNPVRDLSMAEIAGIFSGAIGSWSEVGGPDTPIAAHVFAEGLADDAAFRAMVLTPNAAAMSETARRHDDPLALEAAVAADPAAIGVVNLASVRTARALGLRSACGDVAAPDPFSLKSEEYPLTRRLRLYAGGETLSSWARDLLDFTLSAGAQGIIADAGFVNQEVAAQPRERMVDRLTLAVADPYADLNLEQLRAFVAETRGATRLSTTLRVRPDAEDLDAKAAADIPRLIDYLAHQDMAGREVLLIGFTGPAGKASSNRALSLKRANRALEMLRAAIPSGLLDGVEMRALGFGETAPAVCNAKASGDPANDRVEVWLR